MNPKTRKLVKSLRFAHAAEIAAYHAYEGHWRSVSNQAEQNYIRKIALDELDHMATIKSMLLCLNSEPSAFLNRFGKIVGETIGLMCYYSGWRLPMYVASLMEKIGTSSYVKIAAEAADARLYYMSMKLSQMAMAEKEHEDYFKKVERAEVWINSKRTNERSR